MQVLVFKATWCQPCKALTTIIESLPDTESVNWQFMDVDENPLIVKAFGVRAVPTVIVTNDEGEPIRSKSGAITKSQLLELIEG